MIFKNFSVFITPIIDIDIDTVTDTTVLDIKYSVEKLSNKFIIHSNMDVKFEYLMFFKRHDIDIEIDKNVIIKSNGPYVYI